MKSSPIQSKAILRTVLIILLIGSYGFLLFYKLGVRPLMDWDESTYAEIAKETLLAHQFINLHYFSLPWFEKPPLMIWLTAASFTIFGFTEFAARFWVAIFAIATVSTTYFFVKKAFASELAAFLSVLSYFIIFYYTFYARTLFFDVPVTFFILSAVFMFWLALERSKYFYLFWIALAFGFMTKSVIGLLPLPIAGIYLIYTKKFEAVRKRNFYWGFLIFLGIIAPWHILEFVQFGENFLRPYFGYHVMQRFFSTLGNHSGGLGFYSFIFTQNFLLLVLTLWSVPHFLVAMRKNKRAYALCFISAVFIFLFFSTAGTKLANYIVPVVPFVAIMSGVTLADYIREIRRQLPKILIISALFIILIGLDLGYVRDVVKVNLGWQYNQYLQADMKSDYEIKNAGEYFSTHYINIPLYTTISQYTYPEFSYYAGRSMLIADKIHTPTQRELDSSTKIFSNRDSNFFTMNDYIYATSTSE